MPTANYQYFDDNSNLWQIAVPTDFANILGMVPAVGTEPYLDSQISPRYAIFSSITGATRAAIVQSGTALQQLGSSYNVSGITYTTRTKVAESTPATTGPLLQSPQGPQGPPGTNGLNGAGIPLATSTTYATSDTTLTSANTDVIIIEAFGVSAGTYLVFGRVQFAAAGTCTIALLTTSGGTTPLASASTFQATSSTYTSLTVESMITCPAGDNIKLVAQSTTASAVVKHTDETGRANATALTMVATG
jgi:hypothetical protein